MITQAWLLEHDCKFTNSGEEIRYNCPECDDDDFHLYINKKTNLYHCFKCGFSGKVVVSHEIDVQDYNEVMRKQFNLPTASNLIKNLPPSRLIFDDMKFGGWEYNYLIRRGLTHRQIKRYRVKYSIEKQSKYSNSVIFPIYDPDDTNPNAIKYFVCRKIEGEPKYINAPWPKGDTIFKTLINWNTDNPPVIVEGIFDALAIERAGYPAIALLGKEITKEQDRELKKILTQCRRTLIFLDHDALVYAMKIYMDRANTRIITSEFHDPDSIPTDILKELLEYHSND